MFSQLGPLLHYRTLTSPAPNKLDSKIALTYFNREKVFPNILCNRCTKQCYWCTTVPEKYNSLWENSCVLKFTIVCTHCTYHFWWLAVKSKVIMCPDKDVITILAFCFEKTSRAHSSTLLNQDFMLIKFIHVHML